MKVEKNKDIDSGQVLEHWTNIQQQMMDEFGQDEEQRDYFEALKDSIPFLLKSIICEAKGDIQGRRRNEFEYEIRQARAKSLLPKYGIDPGKWKLHVDKMLGFPIDLKKTSTYDYENYKRQLTNG